MKDYKYFLFSRCNVKEEDLIKVSYDKNLSREENKKNIMNEHAKAVEKHKNK